MPFHNPYHFVPVKPDARPDDLPVSDFVTGKVGQVTHDRFVTATSRDAQTQPIYSGRLVCRLTTEDPIVIGDKRKELPDGSHRVFPLMLEGKPGIPASTLRGLISSIAEAASNSAVRILEDRLFSYRGRMEDSLSALGMTVEVKGEDGKTELKLRPLALPTMVGPRGGAIPLESRYRKMFPLAKTPPLKVYVGGSNQIRSDSFVQGLPFRSFSRDCPEYCYVKLYPRRWEKDHSLVPDPCQNRKAGGREREFLLSQTTMGGLPPCVERNLPENEKERELYTRGILRILGVPGREDIPSNKKHELFIPYPENAESTPTFPILLSALERFYELADERTEARKDGPPLPYEPRGTRRNNAPESAEDHRFRLKDGDLIYFRPDSRGEAVEEIALSAIWRRERGRSHTYFRQISPELLPFHKDRCLVTIAEQLFGFVEQRDGDVQDHHAPARALASRLRFSFGILQSDQEECFEEEVLLKVLDSPKPPSPALYFKRRNGRGAYIAKSELNPNSHAPQGRKFYLHRRGDTGPPWKTLAPEDALKQKSWVNPLKPGLVFYFHIDFESLSQRELGLLCYAVRPTDNFRHKIGMGKPLGLGKVRIDPVGVFYIDRRKRYTDNVLFEARRYHGSWIPDEEKSKSEEWPSSYGREKQAVGGDIAGFPAFDALRQSFIISMDLDIRHALELLGDPANVRHFVHTPQVAGATGREMEKETYKWFVANDIGSGGKGPKKEFLKPLSKSAPLPILPEHPWDD